MKTILPDNDRLDRLSCMLVHECLSDLLGLVSLDHLFQDVQLAILEKVDHVGCEHGGHRLALENS